MNTRKIVKLTPMGRHGMKFACNFQLTEWFQPNINMMSLLKTTPIRGSIPHHERKFNTLQLQKPVRPEVSKGEKDFCRRLRYNNEEMGDRWWQFWIHNPGSAQ